MSERGRVGAGYRAGRGVGVRRGMRRDISGQVSKYILRRDISGQVSKYILQRYIRTGQKVHQNNVIKDNTFYIISLCVILVILGSLSILFT